MPNTVPAAATGLPQIDRRRLLLGVAAASTAAGASMVALPALAATRAEPAEPIQIAEPQVNPKLVALFRDLKEAVAEKAAAKDAKEWLVDECRHRWPLAPEEITLLGFREQHSDSEVNIEGKPIIRPGEQYARRLRSLEDLAWFVERMASNVEKARNEKRRASALKALAEDTRNLRLGEEYYSEIEHFKEASGLTQAKARIEAAKEEIYRIGEALMVIPSSSIACLTIKAEAVEIWFDTMFPLLNEETNFMGWPILMARDIRNVVLGGVS